jgi:mannose-6-phosphate isomerase-like protein (cupin superfamily)
VRGGDTDAVGDRFEVTPFSTLAGLPAETVTAPDGSRVHVLLGLSGGTMARFELPAGQVSIAVEHRTVEEIWFVLSGHGQMWRRLGDQDEVVDLAAGACITIPVGTAFQFRANGTAPLAAIAITMPPWPGEGEAIAHQGKWPPTIVLP